MDKKTSLATLEAVLFAMGNSVELKKLSEVIDASEEDTRAYLYELKEKYDGDDHGIEILELENSFQFATKSEYYELLCKAARMEEFVVNHARIMDRYVSTIAAFTVSVTGYSGFKAVAIQYIMVWPHKAH